MYLMPLARQTNLSDAVQYRKAIFELAAARKEERDLLKICEDAGWGALTEWCTSDYEDAKDALPKAYDERRAAIRKAWGLRPLVRGVAA